MTKTYTLTEEELEKIVNDRLSEKRNKLIRDNLFNDLHFEDELIPINKKYPKVIEKLKRDRSINSEKHVFNQVPYFYGVDKDVSYSKISSNDVHNHIRLLVLNVFGKSKNKDLLPEEYEQARTLYVELKNWYVNSYDKRLSTMKLEDKENEII
ncbi:hypothetical protein SAMN02910293_00447 [Streptococcus henryi]|uniref:Uncharacterized protein n=1 Tax=Streptococcus henryi TaxID=439219 RepID=A0A1G6AKS5_9STRE|nr:hypothetical protein [Streptococcus henryi]QBX25344.1 hypothetical protein Javan252_0043 [Streptococcus phage Javan252]SDB08969.1 hypothetical protein SAMN02910293_00447 [Streptococcus henryi]